jgi:(heptosyl)LPS beta-1,4-glucosyltransferase
MDYRALTFIILTKNEAARLPRALASLPQQVAVFVLDAESTDDTVEIAQAFGARVERRAWTTFADARRYAISMVHTSWFFMLDADEALTLELRDELLFLEPKLAAYRCRRLNRFCGRIMRGGAWADESVLRLARTDIARIEAQASGELHEHVVVDWPVGELSGAIDHDSYPTLDSYYRKFDRYTHIEAATRRGSLKELAQTFALSALRALWQLSFKHGYRDGWRGVFVAFASAGYNIRVSYLAWKGPFGTAD